MLVPRLCAQAGPASSAMIKAMRNVLTSGLLNPVSAVGLIDQTGPAPVSSAAKLAHSHAGWKPASRHIRAAGGRFPPDPFAGFSTTPHKMRRKLGGFCWITASFPLPKTVICR